MVFTAAPPTIHQIFQSLVRSPLGSTPPPFQGVHPTVQQTTATLYALLESLSAPDSGWPETVPKTPETLLPYVMDEAGDLAEALQTTALPPKAERDQPRLFSDWNAHLLWAIAASSADALQLLEGIPAAIAVDPTLDGVRLVPALTLQWSDQVFQLDLVAQAELAVESLLAAESSVERLDRNTILTLSAWRDQLWRSLLTFLPEMAQWQQGVPLEILIPEQDWGSATGQLALHFVGIAAPTLQPILEDGEAFQAKTEPSLLELGMPSPRVWVAQPALGITWVEDGATLQGLDRRSPPWGDRTIAGVSLETELEWDSTDFRTAIAASHLASLGNRLHRQWQASDAPLALETLVAEVFAALSMTDPPPSPESAWRRSPLALGDFCTELQWLWVRLSPDLMPFLAGIPTYRLRPRQSWEVGTLTATGQVWLTLADAEPQGIDITTHQPISTPSLHVDDLLHLQNSPFLPKPLWQTAELEQFLTNQLEPRSPLLPWLLQGVPIRLVTDAPCQGHLQLRLALNFYQLA